MRGKGEKSYHSINGNHATGQGSMPRLQNLHCRGDGDGVILIHLSLLLLEIFLHLPELLQLCGELSAVS